MRWREKNVCVFSSTFKSLFIFNGFLVELVDCSAKERENEGTCLESKASDFFSSIKLFMMIAATSRLCWNVNLLDRKKCFWGNNFDNWFLCWIFYKAFRSIKLVKEIYMQIKILHKKNYHKNWIMEIMMRNIFKSQTFSFYYFSTSRSSS